MNLLKGNMAQQVTRGSHLVAISKAVQARFLMSPRVRLPKDDSARLSPGAPSLGRLMILAVKFLVNFTSWRRW